MAPSILFKTWSIFVSITNLSKLIYTLCVLVDYDNEIKKEGEFVKIKRLCTVTINFKLEKFTIQFSHTLFLSFFFIIFSFLEIIIQNCIISFCNVTTFNCKKANIKINQFGKQVASNKITTHIACPFLVVKFT